MTAPAPDVAEVDRALRALFEPEDVIELRAFNKNRKRTDAGYFDGEHRGDAAEAARRQNGHNAAVYVTLNRLDPQLLGRYSNRIQEFASATATDAHIVRRRWLLVDFDPVRPSNTSASEAQLDAARKRSRACYRALRAEGWPEPIVAESGNGMHLLYPLDLPNDSAARELVKGTLAGLAARFDDAHVSVDQSVFNAARIAKLYGTIANKGDHTDATPWRLSRLVSTPVRDSVLTVEQLRALHPASTESHRSHDSGHRSGSFDLEAFLARLGIEYTHDTHNGTERFKLAHCPFNADHGKGEAAIFRRASGALGFRCQHNGCRDRTWQDVRALVDGPQEARAGQRNSSETFGTFGTPAGEGDEKVCPTPQPLPADIPAVEAFEPLLLPETFRPWCEDIAERIQCPLDFPAVAAMIALSATVGRQCGIKPKRRDSWLAVPNMWGAVVGRPGVLKSPAITEAIRPIRRLETEAREAYETAHANWEAGQMVAKEHKKVTQDQIRKALKTGDRDVRAIAECALQAEADEPTRQRLLIHDTTVERLGEILNENPRGVLLFRDELTGWLRTLERDGHENDRDFYKESWNGDGSYGYDRIGRGTLDIEAACVSILGSIQPGPLSHYMASQGPRWR